MKTHLFSLRIFCQPVLSIHIHSGKYTGRDPGHNQNHNKQDHTDLFPETPWIFQLFGCIYRSGFQFRIQLLLFPFRFLCLLLEKFFSDILCLDTFGSDLFLCFLHDLFYKLIDCFLTSLRNRSSNRFFRPANRTAVFGFLFYFCLFSF